MGVMISLFKHADENPQHPDKEESAQHRLLHQSQTEKLCVLVRVANTQCYKECVCAAQVRVCDSRSC